MCRSGSNAAVTAATAVAPGGAALALAFQRALARPLFFFAGRAAAALAMAFGAQSAAAGLPAAAGAIRARPL